MFRGQKYTKPQNTSLFGVLAVTALVMLGSKASAVVGYFIALSALLIMVVAMHMKSIWPTQARKENALVFSLFWGLMIGAIIPFLVSTYMKGGAAEIYEIFMSKS